jgi:hypothetical protein
MEHKFSSPASPFKNSEEEIAHLRQLISEKERASENLGLKREDLVEARETLAQYKTAKHAEVLHPSFALNEATVGELALKLAPEEHDTQIAELMKLVKEQGIKNALSVVEKLADFHITDDFHRFVAEYLKEGFTIPGLAEKEAIAKGLSMVLYEVLIPEEVDREETKSLSDIIAGMEQFYASMLSLSPDGKSADSWMSLEIANANFSQEIVFYVAVPTSRKSLFEKSIISIFHNAKIREIPDDYNIFNKTGFTAGTYAAFAKKPIYPIKTYENFVHDPLNLILSSFSKVNRDGEGAAIQLIWSPMGDRYLKKYKEALDKNKKRNTAKRSYRYPRQYRW